MSNIAKGNRTNIRIELNSIVVSGGNNKRGECWNFNVNNQFPVILSDMKNGEVSVAVDYPHKGYSIQTTLINGKLNGKSSILNAENIEIATLVFVDGIANGPCKLYDEEGVIFFEGYFVNGYREGKGKEYNDEGKVVFDGFFKEGKRMNIVELKEMKGYWKEMNERNEVISICKKDEEGNNEGICYFYSNGIIDRISEWKNGKEISDSGYCRIYDEPNHVFFEGHFEDGKREGKGKEIDLNGKVVFDGFYKHGNKLNIVPFKEKRGYWKVLNDSNEVISICEKNEKNENDGICYFYVNGTIDKMSEWKNGKELNVLKRFEGKKMIEFVNGVKRYEGEYRDSIENDYCREGNGKEYDTDGKSLIYYGHYWNGRRQGKGKAYKNRRIVYDGIWMKGYPRRNLLITEYTLLILILVCAIIFFIVNDIMGCIMVSLAVIFLVIWIYIFHVRIESDYRLITTVSLKKKLVIRNQCCNLVNTFNLPQFYFELLVVGDDCFENVRTFNIDGLNHLKSIKIGNNSFTHVKSSDINIINDKSRSFSILNCNELESIEIGEYSFSDYSGGFELKNLPKLAVVKIGQSNSDSYNFFYCYSIMFKSIVVFLTYMNRSS